MRPAARPRPTLVEVATFDKPGEPELIIDEDFDEPVPATELLKRPPPPPSPGFSVTVVAGTPARPTAPQALGSSLSIGRERGELRFADDPFVSPLHATLTVRNGALFLRDEMSASGLFLALRSPEQRIAPRGLFAVGGFLFRYLGAAERPQPQPGRPIPYGAPLPQGERAYLLEEMWVGGRPGRSLLTYGRPWTLGSRADCTFVREGLAPIHCEVLPGPEGALLRDHSRGAGVFVKQSGELQLRAGDRIRLGQQILEIHG